MSGGDYRGAVSVPAPGYWAPDDGDERREARYCRCCALQLTVLETDVCSDCRAELGDGDGAE